MKTSVPGAPEAGEKRPQHASTWTQVGQGAVAPASLETRFPGRDRVVGG